MRRLFEQLEGYSRPAESTAAAEGQVPATLDNRGADALDSERLLELCRVRPASFSSSASASPSATPWLSSSSSSWLVQDFAVRVCCSIFCRLTRLVDVARIPIDRVDP